MPPEAAPNVSHNEDGSIIVRIDAKVFALEAVKAAAYRFANTASFAISQPSDTEISVQVRVTSERNTADKHRLIDAFLNEVIDEDLRISVRRETEATRNLILAQAFSKTNLLQ